MGISLVVVRGDGGENRGGRGRDELDSSSDQYRATYLTCILARQL